MRSCVALLALALAARVAAGEPDARAAKAGEFRAQIHERHLARETGDPAEADLRHGLLWRAWLRVRQDRNAYFDRVFFSLEPDACDAGLLAHARAQLAAFPLEKRSLGSNEAALGIPTPLLPGRKWKRLAREIVPIELRPTSSFEWKSSPYRLYASVCSIHDDCRPSDSSATAHAPID